jgi:hypothetical protein
MSASVSSVVSSWLLVLLCAASGAYCLLRVGRAGRAARGAAAGEAVMGFGMAVMAAPLGTGPWGAWFLLVVFTGAAAHAVWLLRGGAHHAHHLIGALAMVYMAVTMVAGPSAGHGHGGGGLPLVTGALLLYFAGYVVLGGTRLITVGGGGGTAVAAEGGDGPSEVVRACRLAMGIGMLAMLPAL